jgi:hypothetical protein
MTDAQRLVAPNQVMEPVYTGANHDPGLALAVLSDVGWPDASAVPAFHSSASVLALAMLLGGLALALVGRGASPPATPGAGREKAEEKGVSAGV